MPTRRSGKGVFNAGLALLSGLSSVLAGVEVAYEHYKGSYGQHVMYTPVVLERGYGRCRNMGIFQPVGCANCAARRCPQLTLLDSLAGFYFQCAGSSANRAAGVCRS